MRTAATDRVNGPRVGVRAKVGAVLSWLGVTALGLSIGALGAGGLMDLFDGEASSVALSSSEAADFSGTAGSESLSAGNSDEGALQANRVVPPAEIPNGVALQGRAPAARVAKAGEYAPFKPTSVRLPSGRLAGVLLAGVHADGALTVPENPGQVGWWTGGSMAGEPYGSMVVAGHVDSRTFGVGVLAEMLTMRPGDYVKLADGVHGELYRVRTVRKVPKVKLAAGTDLFAQDVKHRLVLITCGGPFDQKTHRYRDNVVIVAAPVR